MASVMVDIPGIGVVEAQNAATESTLRDILAALRGGSRGGSGGGAGGGGGAGAGAGAGGAGAAARGLGLLDKSAALFGKSLGALNKAAGFSAAMFVGAAQGGVTVTKGFVALGQASVDLINDFANVGDSLTGAASATGKVFQKIPIVGGLVASMFSAVASAVESSTKAYQSAAGAGATFNGSVNSFSKAATQAGMTMEAFGQLVRRNGEGLGAFGTTTEDGAKRFVQLSKALRTSGSDLYALGYSTAEINQGLANYGKLLRIQGAQGAKSNAELVAGSKRYLKEMDMLAKVTGEDREAKEKEREALAADGQFRAAMAGLGPDVEASAMTLIQSMPSKAMQNFAKDLIANGTATTDANRKILAQMPQLGAQFSALHKQTQKNVKISDDQMNSTLNIGRKEGPESLKRIKYAAAANDEMHETAAAVASFGRVQQNAIKTATEQQATSKAATDGQNQAMEQAKQRLAAVSNSLTMFLANSGILNTMLAAFEGIVKIIQNVAVPVFTFLAGAINTAAKLIQGMFSTAGGEGIVEGFKAFIVKVTDFAGKVYNFVESLFVAVDWQGIATTLFDVGGTIMNAVGTVLTAVQPIFAKVIEVGMQLFDKLAPVVKDIADIISIVAVRLAPIVTPIVQTIGGIIGGFFDMIGGFVKIVKGLLTGDFTTVFAGIKQVVEGFIDRFVGVVKLAIQTVTAPFKFVANLFKSDEEIKKEEIQKAKEERDAALKKAQEKAADGDTKDLDRIKRLEAQRKKADEVKEDIKKTAAAELKQQQKNAAGAKDALETSKKTAEAAQASTIDYTASSENLLKQFATAQGSPLSKTAAAPAAPRSSGPATTEAEARKAAMESDAEKKRADAKAQADAKAAQEAADKKAAESRTAGKSTDSQKSSADLLADLNMNVGKLITLTKTQNDIIESQLRVQKTLSGDVYSIV